MEITRANYEIYFIDYYEGLLTDDQQQRLYRFLEKNPDLKTEFENYSSERQTFTTLNYPHKSWLQHSLKEKSINKKTIDEYCIAYLENDLDNESRLLFENYISLHKAENKMLESYKKTRLSRELQLYAHKKTLLRPIKQSAPYKRMIPYLAAAAGVLFVLMMFLLNQPTEPTDMTAEDPRFIPEMEKLPPKAMKPIQNQMVYNHDTYNPVDYTARQTSINKPSVKPTSESVLLAQIDKLPTVPIENNWIVKDIAIEPRNLRPAYRSQKVRNQLSVESIKKRFLEETEGQLPDVWRLADAGLKGLGVISESEFGLSHTRNQEGKIESITLSTDNFKIKAPLKSKSAVTN
ncbi:MAG: hypothetical protein GVY19_04195 [Bacteroidetes bacterium]|jgi:hypothetical protein|nr:hypothetical protein [Bacteroidota bacterium]